MTFSFEKTLCIIILIQCAKCDYWSDRQKILSKEDRISIGGHQDLNKVERRANEILMKYKNEEWNQGFKDPESYAANKHFFKAKPMIINSPVFNIIKNLPKGASLHSHDTSMVSSEYLFNITFKDQLYLCNRTNNRFSLRFLNSSDENKENCGLLRHLRETNSDFDQFLKKHLTLVVDNPEFEYPDVNVVWDKFMNIFQTVVPMITFKPVFEEYFYQVLKEFYDDQVMYIEFRTTLPKLYDLRNTEYTQADTLGTYKKVLDLFKKDHPDFIGARIIYGPSRFINNETMEDYVKTVRGLHANYSKILAGFDLVGQEDLGRPLKSFINDLLEIKEDLDFFFHAGETNWYGSTTDENLIDAILLQTKRIGHGYALLKHPEVLKYIKANGIAIEVAPISNQVLKLVDDFRNHPASIFMAFGLPMVVCNDDPGFWGAQGLSYDWYFAFMGMADRKADLRFLKQLAINSIQFSSLSGDEKNLFFQKWSLKWDTFVNNLANDYYRYV